MAGKTLFPQTTAATQQAASLARYDWNAPTGNVWWVNSVTGTDSTSYGVSPGAPLATIGQAITNATASNHDVIALMPGHVETITGAAGVLLSKAGITVVGLGVGRARPTFSYSTSTGASFDITAANCRIENVVFVGTGIDALTAMMNIQAADVQIAACEFDFANATNQATLAILTTAAADRLRIGGYGVSPYTGVSERNHFHGTPDAGTAAAIRLVGGNEIRIENNYITGNFTTSKGGIDNITTQCLRILIDGNYIANETASSTVAINLNASTTGMVVNNRLGVLMGTAPIVGAAVYAVGGNYYAAAAGVTAGALI